VRYRVCRACGLAPSTEADHVVLAKKIVQLYGEEAFYDLDRVQGLCKPCHSAKTARGE